MILFIKKCLPVEVGLIFILFVSCEKEALDPPTFDVTVKIFDSNINPVAGARVFLFDEGEHHVQHIELNPDGLPERHADLVKTMGETDENGEVFFERILLGTTVFNRKIYLPNELFIRSVAPIYSNGDTVYISNDEDRYLDGSTYGISWDRVEGAGQHLEKTVELLIR